MIKKGNDNFFYSLIRWRLMVEVLKLIIKYFESCCFLSYLLFEKCEEIDNKFNVIIFLGKIMCNL